MAIETRTLEYSDGSTKLCGQLAVDTTAKGSRPGVLVAHTWAGCGPFERQKAVDLAELGYVALAVDMYGGGIVGSGPEENQRLMKPLMERRATLQRRMLRALETLKCLESVDEERTAALGFCFGGLCALDLARSGAALRAAVSFHGLLSAPGNTGSARVQAKVLVLHGWDDPMATPQEVEALAAEMTGNGADWQVHAYGGTMHAFTNPAAKNVEAGTVYNASADRRSWIAMRNFLQEAFGAEAN